MIRVDRARKVHKSLVFFIIVDRRADGAGVKIQGLESGLVNYITLGD